MVEFDLVAALVGGFVGTVAMTAMMASKEAGMSNMPPMPLVMGSMMTGDRKKAMAIGGMVHLIVMGTIVFGIAYGLLFDAFATTPGGSAPSLARRTGSSSVPCSCR